MMSVQFVPQDILTGSPDQTGHLVLADGKLAAILVRLDDPAHGDDLGRWFLEAGFGRLSKPFKPTFKDLAEAEAWVREHLARLASVR